MSEKEERPPLQDYTNLILKSPAKHHETGSGEAIQEPTIKKPDQIGQTEVSPETTPRRLTLDSDQTTDYESACEGEENPSNLSLLAEELKSVHISTPRALAPLKKFPYSPPEKDLYVNDNVLDETIEKTEFVDPAHDLNETSLCLDLTLNETLNFEKSQILSIKENLSPNLQNPLKTLKTFDGSFQEEFYDSKNFFGADESNFSKSQIKLENGPNPLDKSEISNTSYDSLENSILKRPDETVITPIKDSENQNQSPYPQKSEEETNDIKKSEASTPEKSHDSKETSEHLENHQGTNDIVEIRENFEAGDTATEDVELIQNVEIKKPDPLTDFENTEIKNTYGKVDENLGIKAEETILKEKIVDSILSKVDPITSKVEDNGISQLGEKLDIIVENQNLIKDKTSQVQALVAVEPTTVNLKETLVQEDENKLKENIEEPLVSESEKADPSKSENLIDETQGEKLDISLVESQNLIKDKEFQIQVVVAVEPTTVNLKEKSVQEDDNKLKEKENIEEPLISDSEKADPSKCENLIDGTREKKSDFNIEISQEGNIEFKEEQIHLLADDQSKKVEPEPKENSENFVEKSSQNIEKDNVRVEDKNNAQSEKVNSLNDKKFTEELNFNDSNKDIAKKSIKLSLNEEISDEKPIKSDGFKEPKKSVNKNESTETESSIAFGGSDFPNSFSDTISETFSPQACDLSRLELKLDEKLTLTQALTDETILELKNKEYSEEYFSITEAVNEREKLNGHPNNRSLSVINEESFLVSSSDTELFKSDSTSLASSFREDSLEPDLNPISREDSLEPSSLFARTLNGMEKSYNSLQEIYETCSKQERELGCSDVVEPVLFNLSISAEAKRLADDFSKMDLTSETLKDIKPPQHMMHSVNSSEAGPVTADEDFKKTDKFCNAADFDFEAIDKLEKSDQNKTALPRDSIFLKFDPLFQHIQKEADQSIMSDHDPEKTVIENKTPQKDRVNAVTPINREKRASNSSSPNAGSKTPGSDFLSKEIAKLQELMLQQEAAHQHVALECEEKTEKIEQLKKRVAELESRDPNVGLEGKLKHLEAENAKLKKELNTTKTENKQLVNVMEEYEKTISQLMASKEEMQNEYEKVKEKIAMERDDAVSHLNNLEVAFSDVHLKYEKSKTIIEQLHNNEKLMNESLQEHVKIIAKKNANYEKLKVHATEKLAAANQEIANLTNTHKMEITKLNASNKRAELTIKSLEEALEQKKSEIRELTQICDELIGTTTSKN